MLVRGGGGVRPQRRVPAASDNAVWAGRARLLYGLYSRLDARRFGAALNPFDEIDLSDRLGRLPVLEVVPIAPKPDERRFDADAISKLEGWDLDVMLSLGFRIIGGAVLDCARYGVWSYHHDDPDSYRGGRRCSGRSTTERRCQEAPWSGSPMNKPRAI